MTIQHRPKASYCLFVLSLTLFLPLSGIWAESARAEAKPIRIGLMADFTGLPFLVAEKEGLFAKEGLSLEFKIFRSAVERDAALQAGALDGCNADLISAIANLRAGYDLRIVAAAPNRFSLLAGPALVASTRKKGREPNITDLEGASIGISKNTVIEYVLDSLAEDAGLTGYKKTDVSRIPIRLELLLQGKLQAACLPLPFDELALAEGAVIVADSLSAGLDPDLFMFYAKDLQDRKPSYQALWRSVDAACKLINLRPNSYRSLLSERLGFSEPQAASIQFPSFPAFTLTSDSQIERASSWMQKNGLISRGVSPAEISAGGFLP